MRKGQDCIGDITCATREDEKPSPIKLDQVNFYDLFDESLKEAPLESVAGVQEKISASMISFPLNLKQNKKRYILKLNPKDKKNLIENEFYCMSLAKSCGIRVAGMKRIIDKDGNEGLLVERFDRIWNEEKHDFDFIHQEDGCQILNIYPSQKYLTSINDLAKKIVEIVPSPELEVLTLVQWIAFTYLVGNGDLHAKNLSLQDMPGRVRQFTPAYDLISTCIYGDSKLALKIDGFDDNLTQKLLIDFCNRFEIPTKAAKLMLDKLIHKFSARNSEFLQKIRMSEKERSRLDQLIKKRLKNLSDSESR